MNSVSSSSKTSSQIPNEIIELTIDSLSYNGGRGVGRHEGLVVFVPGTAPQDLVRVRITSKKAKFWEGEVEEILKPSPFRRTPPCPVADRCGGCSWQHIEYSCQAEQKQKILEASLRPLAKVAKWDWLPFVTAPSEFHYRNRIQVQVKNGKKGFFAKRSHELVAVEECWIADHSLNQQLKRLKVDPALSRLELRTDAQSDFAQVNDRQNENLKKLLVERVTVKPDWIMDLYAGSGNLTLPLAQKFQATEVTAVELSAGAVARAKAANARIEWLAGDVEKVLKRVDKSDGVGLIVLDPPRTGCEPGVLRELARLAPKQIVYVSCNPTTFARDAVRLVEAGFHVSSVQGLDMFPQTEHVELLASLIRQN